MPDTVRENIFLNLENALNTIRVINGYDNDIQSVQRWRQNGNNLKDVPAIIVNSGPESNEDKPFPLTKCNLTIYLDLWVRQNESSTEGTDILLNSLLGDIKKALKVDITRGGNAVDTKFGDTVPFETVEGEPHAGLVIEVLIEYRHQQTDPKIVG